jgi:hypothetical protein
VDGTAAQARITNWEPPVAPLQAQGQDLPARLGRSVEMTPEKPAERAGVAQAEGVRLPVARRLLQVVRAPKSRSVPTLGRATLAAGQRAGRLLAVRDEAVRPRVDQAAADEIWGAANQP